VEHLRVGYVTVRNCVLASAYGGKTPPDDSDLMGKLCAIAMVLAETGENESTTKRLLALAEAPEDMQPRAAQMMAAEALRRAGFVHHIRDFDAEGRRPWLFVRSLPKRRAYRRLPKDERETMASSP